MHCILSRYHLVNDVTFSTRNLLSFSLSGSAFFIRSVSLEGFIVSVVKTFHILGTFAAAGLLVVGHIHSYVRYSQTVLSTFLLEFFCFCHFYSVRKEQKYTWLWQFLNMVYWSDYRTLVAYLLRILIVSTTFQLYAEAETWSAIYQYSAIIPSPPVLSCYLVPHTTAPTGNPTVQLGQYFYFWITAGALDG